MAGEAALLDSDEVIKALTALARAIEVEREGRMRAEASMREALVAAERELQEALTQLAAANRISLEQTAELARLEQALAEERA